MYLPAVPEVQQAVAAQEGQVAARQGQPAPAPDGARGSERRSGYRNPPAPADHWTDQPQVAFRPACAWLKLTCLHLLASLMTDRSVIMKAQDSPAVKPADPP